jgi:secernin
MDELQEYQPMGCDMVVALPAATGGKQTLFGANHHRPIGEAQCVRFVPGRTSAPGEPLRTRFLQIPQVRQTFAALALQSVGVGGWLCGVNERRVAVSCSHWQSRDLGEMPGLLGPELVRLTLERAHTAGHALEVLTDLIVRHGQGSFPGSPEGVNGDHVFLLADPHEAFAVEAAGFAWAAQEIHQVRAAGDVGVIRQDWYRLAPGLADRAIAEGWWAPDGSKLDFVGTLSEAPTGIESALRRWGRATLLLEQQNGHVDAACLRRLLADHYEGTHYEVDPLHGPGRVTPLCQHDSHGAISATAISAVAQLPVDENLRPIVWVALGPPCVNVHFPLLLDGELPAAFWDEPAAAWSRVRQLAVYRGTDPHHWLRIRDVLGRLQARFEQDAEEFLEEAAELRQRGEYAELRRLAGSLMQSHVERYEEAVRAVLGESGLVAAAAIEAAVSCGAEF